jgi:penicillin-binding protein 2
MLVFDQIRRGDRSLQTLALVFLAGMLTLLGGLWYVQVVSAKKYRASLEVQAFRTVRVPAMRGKILDRHGAVLVENQPSYNVALYLEELSRRFRVQFLALRKEFLRQNPGRNRLAPGESGALERHARFLVVNEITRQVGTALQLPLELDERRFNFHFGNMRALPLMLLTNLGPQQIALFVERAANLPGVDLEIQPVRVYTQGPLASHLIGHLKRFEGDTEDPDEPNFTYRLPDLKGEFGVEAAFDSELRGKPGVKSILVNNLNYRQSETVWTPADPGENVVLTLDAEIQRTADAAMRSGFQGTNTRGAVIVMDAHAGDILAMTSSPAFDPNAFIDGITDEEWQRLNVPALRPMFNRATYGVYAPGSIFKIVVGLAALEHGLDPSASYRVQADPSKPGHGCIYVGRRKIEDTAPPGEYDFRRAFLKSSNAYFIHQGLAVGLDRIVAMGAKLHLGERFGLPFRQESSGTLPTAAWIREERTGWSPGDTANLCIGQGDIAVTPLQMAVMTAAIVNGGKVLWPRFVERIEPQDPLSAASRRHFPSGQVRDQLPVSPRNLQIIREGMFADTEDAEATAFAAFHERDKRTPVLDFRVGGKTGTAQVTQGKRVVDHITWFTSFGECRGRTYVVVVMIESAGSGGGSCAPVAADVYRTIRKRALNPPVPRHPGPALAGA